MRRQRGYRSFQNLNNYMNLVPYSEMVPNGMITANHANFSPQSWYQPTSSYIPYPNTQIGFNQPNIMQPYHPLQQQPLQPQPLQPLQLMQSQQIPNPMSGFLQNGYPVANPYPTQQQGNRPPSNNAIMKQFKKSDGQFDIDKMMNTAGQVMSAMNQLGSLVKGVTSVFKV